MCSSHLVDEGIGAGGSGAGGHGRRRGWGRHRGSCWRRGRHLSGCCSDGLTGIQRTEASGRCWSPGEIGVLGSSALELQRLSREHGICNAFHMLLSSTVMEIAPCGHIIAAAQPNCNCSCMGACTHDSKEVSYQAQ